MQHDAWAFIGVFVFIFLVWVATGGPTHPLSFSGPYLSAPGPLGGGSYLSFPRAPFSIGNSSTDLDGGSSYGGNTNNPNTIPKTGVSFGPPSSYRSLVTLNHYVASASSSDPNNEMLQLYVSQNAGGSVAISNWLMRSEASGKAAYIPLGTEVPASGRVNTLAPIVLNPGDRAYIISGRSPIGVSFRENICIGYLSLLQNFNPALPRTCPAPLDEMDRFYTGNYVQDDKCVSYASSLRRCESYFGAPQGLTASCTNFLKSHINYNGCVAYHGGDKTFKGKTWYIYLGRTKPLWRSNHEAVKLLDADGKTVDAFSY